MMRGGGSIYYGLRQGSFTGQRRERGGERGKRYVPTFDEALAWATSTELEKAIAYMERNPSAPYAALRLERMTQRLAELDAQGKDTP